MSEFDIFVFLNRGRGGPIDHGFAASVSSRTETEVTGATSIVAYIARGRRRVHRHSLSTVFGTLAFQLSVELVRESELSDCTFPLATWAYTGLWSSWNTHPSRWSCFMAASQQFIFNVESSILERVFRHQGRTTQVSSSYQDLVSILVKCVLYWMGRRRFRWCLLSPNKGSEQRVFRRANETRVDSPLSGRGKKLVISRGVLAS